uniref:FI03640p n=1 Tax=Drosophila melanogaster TaxID=7227 RepID=D3DN01_DROME|nr:FI03640p [Drosophila melanogaster]
MASSATNVDGGSGTSTALPSLFPAVGAAAGVKDMDGLMAINDSALSQQIEFILQDAPMEQDDDPHQHTHVHHHHHSQHHPHSHSHQQQQQQQEEEEERNVQEELEQDQQRNVLRRVHDAAMWS